MIKPYLKKMKTIAFYLVCAFSITTSCFAKNIQEFKTIGDLAVSEVTVSVSAEPAIFNVSLPTSLSVVMKSDGDITTATEAKIKNNSASPIKISNIKIAPLNGWETTDYNSNMHAEKVGEKKIAIEINGIQTTTTSKDVALDDSYFGIINGGTESIDIVYNAKIPAQQKAIETETAVANIVFTIQWK